MVEIANVGSRVLEAMRCAWLFCVRLAGEDVEPFSDVLESGFHPVRREPAKWGGLRRENPRSTAVKPLIFASPCIKLFFIEHVNTHCSCACLASVSPRAWLLVV